MAGPMRDESQRESQRPGPRTNGARRAPLVAASQAEGTTVPDLAVRHATGDAEDVPADRRVFMVSGEVWDRFAAALDRPAADVPGLEELMSTPTVLDRT